MKSHAFPRLARLKSRKAIDVLFGRCGSSGQRPLLKSALAYPLRVVWNEAPYRADAYSGVRVMVSVPKKKLRNAVDRVKIRRRVREAWRLSVDKVNETTVDVALVYVADKLIDYSKIYASVQKILTKLQENID